jgi:hypothetical protein
MQEASPVASTKKDAAAAAAVVPAATAAAMEDGEDEAAAQEDGDEARSEATFSFKAQNHQIFLYLCLACSYTNNTRPDQRPPSASKHRIIRFLVHLAWPAVLLMAFFRII